MLKVKFSERVSEKLASAPSRIEVGMAGGMSESVIDLARYIQAEKLSGQVLGVVKDKLRNSLATSVEQVGPAQVRGSVFTQGVPYAAIHEYGGTTRPHMIYPKSAGGMLVFEWRGEMQYRKSVSHPGSKMPERSYMRTALADRIDIIRRSVLAGALRGMAL